MKYLLFVLLLSIAFISCRKNSEIKDELKNESEDVSQVNENEISIIDADFINDPFEFGRIDIQILKKVFGKECKIKKEPVENIHVEDQIDTVYTVNIKNSKFVIYKIPDNQFLEGAEINDSSIILKRNIHTGILKEDFKEKFVELQNIKNIPDTITVQGEDAEGYLILTFKNSFLNKIEFVGYVD